MDAEGVACVTHEAIIEKAIECDVEIFLHSFPKIPSHTVCPVFPEIFF